MKLTVAYITNRLNPRFHWMVDSLHKQVKDGDEIDIVVIDYWLWNEEVAKTRKAEFYRIVNGRFPLTHHEPMPNVWAGPHRKTKRDWWIAATARNTAICLAKGDGIAFVDDLSVFLPGWLDNVRHAYHHGYVMCGAYKKVQELTVEDGEIKHYKEFPGGIDSRLQYWKTNGIQDCGGSWLFGCSFYASLGLMLDINGLDGLSDGLSMEDVLLGIRLQKHGARICYNGNAMTFESEEGHHETALTCVRSDYKGNHERPMKDWSHYILHLTETGSSLSKGTPDLRRIRSELLAGRPFPVQTEPNHHYYTKVPLQDLEPE